VPRKCIGYQFFDLVSGPVLLAALLRWPLACCWA